MDELFLSECETNYGPFQVFAVRFFSLCFRTPASEIQKNRSRRGRTRSIYCRDERIELMIDLRVKCGGKCGIRLMGNYFLDLIICKLNLIN